MTTSKIATCHRTAAWFSTRCCVCVIKIHIKSFYDRLLINSHLLSLLQFSKQCNVHGGKVKWHFVVSSVRLSRVPKGCDNLAKKGGLTKTTSDPRTSAGMLLSKLSRGRSCRAGCRTVHRAIASKQVCPLSLFMFTFSLTKNIDLPVCYGSIQRPPIGEDTPLFRFSELFPCLIRWRDFSWQATQEPLADPVRRQGRPSLTSHCVRYLRNSVRFCFT